MKLLNVIHEEPLVNHEPLDYINYLNPVDIVVHTPILDAEEFILDHTKFAIGPTLVVGYGLYKHLYHEQYKADIFKKEVVKNTLYWEFAYSENKTQFFEGIFDHILKKPLLHYYATIKYEILDPVFYNIKSLSDIYNIVRPSFAYQYKDMLYLHSDKLIYGIDLIAYDYFGFNAGDIVMQYSGDLHFQYVNDPTGEIYLSYNKQFPYVDNLKRYIVLLLENESE